MLFASPIVYPAFLIKRFAFLQRFIRNVPARLPFCFAESQDTVELGTLNLNERFYSDQYILSILAKQSPGIAVFPSRNFLAHIEAAFWKIDSEPIHEISTRIYYDEPMGIISLFPDTIVRRAHSFYAYCSFAIDNACKICELFIGPHKNPFIYGYQRTIDNIKCHSERLNEKTLNKGCDSLTSMET